MRLSKFIRYLYYRLLPASCILCGVSLKEAISLCTACCEDLPILPKYCRICASFLTHDSQGDDDCLICGDCLKTPPAFSQTYALFPYETPLPQLISALKFRHQLYCANLFGKLLLAKIHQEWYKNQPLPDLIIPVPLHPKRLRERGFNQALEITKSIAKTLKIPIDSDHIKRIKPTSPQSGLKAKDRKHNLEDAFVSDYNYSNLNIAIVDDVITTGNTVKSMSQVLKANGAKNIHVWCCARRG